jgi:hypothetical protein
MRAGTKVNDMGASRTRNFSEAGADAYADDILFCFQYRKDAIRFLRASRFRLGKFGLKLNNDKTRLHRFGRFAERDRKIRNEKQATLWSLGFTFYNRLSKAGKYMVGCRTQSRRLNDAMNRVTAWCKANRHQSVEWQDRYLNAMLRGHYNYYGVLVTSRALRLFITTLEGCGAGI